MSQPSPRQAAEDAFQQAVRAARRGDAAAAERWSKTAQRLAVVAQRLAALPAPVEPAEDEEALRAELRERLARFTHAALAQEAWESERSEYETAVSRALREGTPFPPALPPAPGCDADLERIARGEG